MLATNDQNVRAPSAFKTNLQSIITRVKTALPLADIVLVVPCENGRVNTYAMSLYADVTYQLAVTNKCAYLDLQYVFGEEFSEYASTSPRNWFNADLIHPEPSTGGRAIVDAIYRLLTKI
jgi:lysophospholipase L1-like esterase